MVFVSERDLIGNKKRLHRKENRFRKEIDDELKNITIGDFIVHEDYGIGRFLGIENKKIAQFHGDFFTVQYKNNERLYLPIDRLYKVHKYISAGVYKPVLDSLRSQKWITKKSRAAKSLEKMLLSIINLYAEREISKGYAFSKNNELHKSFENDFLYEETIDQEKVIKEIEGDMELEKPMDRLLVGDVGFGKTEVAMRSAFKAVFDGKQVAVLAPTTILCEQHFITFKSRFERYGLSISMLSRIVSPKNRWKIIKGIKYGDINIVI